MKIAICITTRNQPERLDDCLRNLWKSTIKPDVVIVSDDSQEIAMQDKNRQVVERYSGTTYILGPQRGVNANRNCSVNSVSADIDLVEFVDDDIWIDADFIANALSRYQNLSPQERKHTFITGVSYTKSGQESLPAKLSFRGYYQPTDGEPTTVHIHAAVFPRTFFEEEQWEEDIFFGQGDAILCLRALKRGYRILYCPELRALNTRPEGGTLAVGGIGTLTDYDIHQQAARLHIGIKRYKELYPNPAKLLAFIVVYFLHIITYLYRKNALKVFPVIIQRSRIQQLLMNSQ